MLPYIAEFVIYPSVSHYTAPIQYFNIEGMVQQGLYRGSEGIPGYKISNSLNDTNVAWHLRANLRNTAFNQSVNQLMFRKG